MYDHTPFRLCYDPCDRLETVDRFDRRVVLHHITYHIPSYHIVLKLKNENEIYGFLRHAYFTVPVIYPKKVVSYAYQVSFCLRSRISSPPIPCQISFFSNVLSGAVRATTDKKPSFINSSCLVVLSCTGRSSRQFGSPLLFLFYRLHHAGAKLERSLGQT